MCVKQGQQESRGIVPKAIRDGRSWDYNDRLSYEVPPSRHCDGTESDMFWSWKIVAGRIEFDGRTITQSLGNRLQRCTKRHVVE